MRTAHSEPTSADDELTAHVRRRALHVARLRGVLSCGPVRRMVSYGPHGDVSKLRRGAYTLADIDGLSDADRLIVMACAVHEAAATPPVFSDDTACAMWDLPTIGARSSRVEYAVRPGTRGRTPDVRRRRTGLSTPYVELGGLRVTPYERTIVDHARHASLESAVSVCDDALHRSLTTREALLAEWQRVPKGHRGRRMAELAIFLADERAESPLESLSRVRMFQAGLPKPELQWKLFDGDGFIGRTDFYWKHLGLVGECDGKLKYAVAAADSGRSGVDSLLREKHRELRLRRQVDVQDIARWDWDEALPPGQLHGILAAHGMRSVLDGGWPVPDGPLPRGAFPTDRLR